MRVCMCVRADVPKSQFIHTLAHACRAHTHSHSHSHSHTHLDSRIATDVINLPQRTSFQEIDHDLCRIVHVFHVTFGLQIAVVKLRLDANTQFDRIDLHCEVLLSQGLWRHLSKETYNSQNRPPFSRRPRHRKEIIESERARARESESVRKSGRARARRVIESESERERKVHIMIHIMKF